MTSIIPRKLIKHLEWTPGQEVPVRKPVSSPAKSPLTPQSMIHIDDILKGETFSDSNMPTALQQALDFGGSNGYVATMPELIAAKMKVDSSHDFWQRWYTVHTEENIGVDQKGRFYAPNEAVLVLVNGGGILTPERIGKAYDENLVNGSARYRDEEFNDLLDGKLPDGTSIELYAFEDIKRRVSTIPHKFGVVMPYSMAQNTESTYVGKKEFLENPLVIARNAGLQNLEEYFDRAKDTSDDTLGCYHPFEGRDASVPQGRLLFLYYYFNGLHGYDNLDDNGRFVGVAPEARSARK